MRILGGRFRGRRLRAPRGLATRPMIARVREAVFNIVADRVEGARVADLYSGTGAIGLEALSRGADHVDFFETRRDALRVLTANAETLGVRDRVTVHRAPLPGAITPGPAWDLVFVDPPWGRDLGSPAIEAVLAQDRLAADGLIILDERHGLGGDDGEWRERGLRVVDRRRYGDSGVLLMVPSG
ncbi:MAG: 16S rRNA (guanine(966)-N(2))-methyltransferase RsmD [Myxococcota bacterium]